jgi:hypothetical protein
MTWLSLIALAVGILLIYSAVTGKSPAAVLKSAKNRRKP